MRALTLMQVSAMIDGPGNDEGPPTDVDSRDWGREVALLMGLYGLTVEQVGALELKQYAALVDAVPEVLRMRGHATG